MSDIAPVWFVGVDVFLEVIFAVVTLLTAFVSLKISRLSSSREIRLFGTAFLFLSLSYFSQSAVNFFLRLSYPDQVIHDLFSCTWDNVHFLVPVGVYGHLIFFMLGLITLVYLFFDFKYVKTYCLITTLVAIALVFSTNRFFMFYVFASVFLAYICLHYFLVYCKTRDVRNLLVLTSFIFLLASHLQFVLSLGRGSFYMIGHWLEFVAYLLLLTNLVVVLRKHGWKKNQIADNL